jgi:transcriptional regulator with XRE-family HTH domain
MSSTNKHRIADVAKTKTDPRAQRLHTILAQNLRQARETFAGLSQAAAAQKSRVDANAISRYERADTVPSIAAVKALADAYGVSVDDLLSERPSFLTATRKTSQPRSN